MAHTLGPWMARGAVICGADPNNHGQMIPIASVFGGWLDEKDWRADARLMAAAPDLLAACKAALDAHNANPPKGVLCIAHGELTIGQVLRAAIAKAEGQA